MSLNCHDFIRGHDLTSNSLPTRTHADLTNNSLPTRTCKAKHNSQFRNHKGLILHLRGGVEQENIDDLMRSAHEEERALLAQEGASGQRLWINHGEELETHVLPPAVAALVQQAHDEEMSMLADEIREYQKVWNEISFCTPGIFTCVSAQG